MVQPIAFPDADPKEFWQAYLDWQNRASIDELRQVEAALEPLAAREVMTLARAMRLALADEDTVRELPDGLVLQMKAVRWPSQERPAVDRESQHA